MCCCDNKSETLGLLDPIYAGTGILQPPGTPDGNYWNWDDPPPRHDGGGSIGNGVALMPAIATPTAAPATPAATVADDEPINSTTILIVIGILGAVFLATR